MYIILILNVRNDGPTILKACISLSCYFIIITLAFHVFMYYKWLDDDNVTKMCHHFSKQLMLLWAVNK